MSKQNEAIASMMLERLRSRAVSPSTVMAIVYVEEHTFRILPADGKRIKALEDDFPGCIVGYYTREVADEDFIDDILAYFSSMGASS